MINVGFYVGDLDLRNGGVAPYAQRVLGALSQHRLDAGMNVAVIGRNSPLTEASSLPLIATPRRFRETRVGRWRRRASEALTALQGRAADPASSHGACKVCRFLRKLKLDVLHVPYQTPPCFALPTPTIITMHDVQELHLPEFFTAEERRYRAVHYLQAIRQAAAIVVSFEHVKQDLHRFFDCPDGQVVVAPLPYGQCTLRSPRDAQRRELQAKYARYPNFFLYPAQTWEHKNHLRLVEAFEAVSRGVDAPLALVCTGKKNRHFAAIEARLQKSPVREQIIFTDVVDESELRWLYESCLGVVIPTLYEAGSFPLIEAMQLGAPVVCARTTSLPDTIGDDQFLFDPRDVGQIARRMTQIALDADYRAASVALGSRRSSELINPQIGSTYEQLWRRVAQRGRARRWTPLRAAAL